MLAKRSNLRAAVNRKMKISGNYQVSVDSVTVPVGSIIPIKAVKAKGDTGEAVYPAGSILLISTEGPIKIHDRVAHIKYPSTFYQYGIVSGPSILDEQDGEEFIRCTLQLFTDVEQSVLSNTQIKLYVEGE